MAAGLSYLLHDLIVARINQNGAVVGLCATEPSSDGSSVSEPNTIYGYARQPFSFGSATRSGGVTTITNTTSMVFGAATGSDWPAVTWAGLFDAQTGDLLTKAALPAPKTVRSGDSTAFGIGTFQFRFR